MKFMLKYSFLFILLSIGVNILSAQNQIGGDLLGEGFNNQFGSALATSSNGERVAVGAWRNSEAGSNAGRVRVFEENDGVWSTVIGNLDGAGNGDRFGYAVSLSDNGQRLAVGIPGKTTNGGLGSGQVIVYEEQNGTWVEIGAPINGQANGENLGTAVALSAQGDRLVARTYVGGLGSAGGQVRVYQEVNGLWSQIGVDLDAAEGADSNTELAISGDGTRVAIGSSSAASARGSVKVYAEASGQWVETFSLTGTDPGDLFGAAVALSEDGLRLLVGAPGVDLADTDTGEALVYEDSNGSWVNITTLAGSLSGDSFGQDLAISSDGTRIAISAPKNDDTGIDAGQVKVFEENGPLWPQIGNNINGDLGGIEAGTKLSLSGDGGRVAIGAWKDDQNGTDAGLVQVYELSSGCQTSTSVDIVESCQRFTWIDGNVYTESNSTATFTLTNAAGCDSVITLNLTISIPSSIDPSLSNDGTSLTANEPEATYQWVSCGGGFPPVVGEVGQSFTPTESGTYAVIIRKGGCEIISACQTITLTTNTQTILQRAGITIYPNPANQFLHIRQFERLSQSVIRDVTGQIVLRVDQSRVDLSSLPDGAYILTALLDRQPVRMLFIKR